MSKSERASHLGPHAGVGGDNNSNTCLFGDFIEVHNSWGMYSSQWRGEVTKAQKLRNSTEIISQDSIKDLTFYSAEKELQVDQREVDTWFGSR